MRKWKVIDRGKVPDGRTSNYEFTCMGCMNESMLPITGLPLAQCDSGVVFDIGGHSMPQSIKCPHCRRSYELEPSAESSDHVR